MRNSILVLVLASAGLVAGCSKDSDTPKYRQLEGRVASIDTTTGVVEMTWFNPKQKKEMTLSGKLAPDAEIFINGATARLEDIEIDDKVVVTGREEKRDGDRQLVAIKVEVTRGTTAPATAPS